MIIRKTQDATLHGVKYCIQDGRGNIISVLPTLESAERDFAVIGIKSDSIVKVFFTK